MPSFRSVAPLAVLSPSMSVVFVILEWMSWLGRRVMVLRNICWFVKRCEIDRLWKMGK